MLDWLGREGEVVGGGAGYQLAVLPRLRSQKRGRWAGGGKGRTQVEWNVGLVPRWPDDPAFNTRGGGGRQVGGGVSCC
jgi:hypothetical protein